MYQITGITDNATQNLSMVLPDGSTITMTMYYILQQSGWFFTNLQYSSGWNLQGVRITNNPNILYQWRNLVPFGLACFSTNDIEPTQITSFISGASNLYVLTAAEVAGYTAYINGG